MLSLGKTIEILGEKISKEKAEEIRSFTYELAELILESTINLNNNYEKQITISGNKLGVGRRDDETGKGLEEDSAATTTTGDVGGI